MHRALKARLAPPRSNSAAHLPSLPQAEYQSARTTKRVAKLTGHRILAIFRKEIGQGMVESVERRPQRAHGGFCRAAIAGVRRAGGCGCTDRHGDATTNSKERVAPLLHGMHMQRVPLSPPLHHPSTRRSPARRVSIHPSIVRMDGMMMRRCSGAASPPAKREKDTE